MFSKGIQIANTSILAGTETPAVSLDHGMQGVIVGTFGAGYDPALTLATVKLKMGGVVGSGYVLAHSSKIFANQALLGPFFFPAGEYVLQMSGGSTVSNVSVGIFPTP